MTYQWRFLLIEDKDDIARQVEEAVDTFVIEPDTATIERKASFKDGIQRLRETRFDILILDLKDDENAVLGEHDVSAGIAIFEALKAIRFAPVVFYTAHAHKVKHLINPFVRVVEKTEGIEKLALEIKNVMATGLPNLSQIIESIQRDYMWDFVSNHWQEFDGPQNKTDIAYLMARRLAATLELQAVTLAQQVAKDGAGQAITGSDVHPMQMYVYPTVSQHQGGDIVKGEVNKVPGVWIILTPTCDLVQIKAEKVLLARCIPVTQTIEHLAWVKEPEGKSERALQDLIGDHRKPFENGPKKVQFERYKYLPGTFFLDDSVVDFQDVVTVSIAELSTLTRVACLDSPFAEALLGGFTRYYSRLGTPDISKAAVLERLGILRKKHNPPAPGMKP